MRIRRDNVKMKTSAQHNKDISSSKRRKGQSVNKNKLLRNKHIDESICNDGFSDLREQIDTKKDQLNRIKSCSDRETPAEEQNLNLKPAVLTPINANRIIEHHGRVEGTGKWLKGLQQHGNRGSPTIVHLHRSGSIEISVPLNHLDNVTSSDEDADGDENNFSHTNNREEMANIDAHKTRRFDSSFSGTATMGDRAFLLRQKLRKQTDLILH